MAHDLLQALERAQGAAAFAERRGVLQGLDPRVKLMAAVFLIISSVLTHSLIMLACLFGITVSTVLASGVPLRPLFARTCAGVLGFTGLIALPALVVVPGDRLWTLPGLTLPISYQGLRSAIFLVGRAETSATLALLLIVTTPWPHVLKALRSLGAPVVLVAILGMTHRYIFLLLQSALQMFESRRSRLVTPMSGARHRQMAIATAATLLGKTFHLSGEVHMAMISRGYRGDIRLLDEFRMKTRDWFALLLATCVPVFTLWFQP